MSIMAVKFLLDRPAFTAAASFVGYFVRYEAAVLATNYFQALGMDVFLSSSAVGTAFLFIGILAVLVHLSEGGVSLPDVPSLGSSSTHTGVRNWAERPHVPSSIYCPVCGYNADVTEEQRAQLCGECTYGGKRTDHWNIPDAAADDEEYGELREDYVRGEMTLREFERRVEVEASLVDLASDEL